MRLIVVPDVLKAHRDGREVLDSALRWVRTLFRAAIESIEANHTV